MLKQTNKNNILQYKKKSNIYIFFSNDNTISVSKYGKFVYQK